MSATARRGWLVAALVVAVTVLIGTFLAAAAWGGAFVHASAFSVAGGCPGGITREWREQRGDRPGMMDGYRGFRPGMMDEWSNS